MIIGGLCLIPLAVFAIWIGVRANILPYVVGAAGTAAVAILLAAAIAPRVCPDEYDCRFEGFLWGAPILTAIVLWSFAVSVRKPAKLRHLAIATSTIVGVGAVLLVPAALEAPTDGDGLFVLSVAPLVLVWTYPIALLAGLFGRAFSEARSG